MSTSAALRGRVHLLTRIERFSAFRYRTTHPQDVQLPHYLFQALCIYLLMRAAWEYDNCVCQRLSKDLCAMRVQLPGSRIWPQIDQCREGMVALTAAYCKANAADQSRIGAQLLLSSTIESFVLDLLHRSDTELLRMVCELLWQCFF